jgi:beta-1,4-mannosyltransferase
MHIIVIVLGDLGRSPRMQYHCQSLLEAGHFVTAIGYKGEALIPSLAQQDGTRLHSIRFNVPTMFRNSGIPLLYFVWRIVSLTLYLGYALLVTARHQPVDFVLVQNPPAIPLLGVAYVYCRIKSWTQRRRPGFIIDWHNLGYSMLRDGSIIQRIAKVYEKLVAPRADGHLTVTKAMKEYLITHMGVPNTNIDVLYDCPPDMFAPLELDDQHKMLGKLHAELCAACPPAWSTSALSAPLQTLFTEAGDYGCRPRPGRPALVTSSTSWTEDEDFGLLLEALQLLDERIRSTQLRVVLVVTGKGPQRAMYQEKLSKLTLHNVAVATVWLEAADYPKLLACADVGISLHTSTSGLDLPMKVLDLFGCEVPVLAYDFDCLSELVQDNVNGRVFRTSRELADLLYEVLVPLATTTPMSNHAYGALQVYSQQLKGRTRWSTNWLEHALPVIMLSTPMK